MRCRQYHGETKTKISRLLAGWRRGQPRARDQLIEQVYDELLRIGRRLRRGERRYHTLPTAALVNEAYLRLAALRRIEWRDRGQFFAAVAGTMRRVLIDQARGNSASKRGGDCQRVILDDDNLPAAAADHTTGAVDVIALSVALDRLAARDPLQARIVELRYFAGLTIEETAAALQIAPATVKRQWALAKVWLYRELYPA